MTFRDLQTSSTYVFINVSLAHQEEHHRTTKLPHLITLIKTITVGYSAGRIHGGEWIVEF